MKISGSPVPLPPAAISHVRSPERAAGTVAPGDFRPAATSATDPAALPAPGSPAAPGTPESDVATNTVKAHGPAGAAAHSHRNDVAALRQWINHSDLRSDLPLPALSGDHKGNGFQRAVAAYEAVLATTGPTPAPGNDPAPAADFTPIVDPASVTDPTTVSDRLPVADLTPSADVGAGS